MNFEICYHNDYYSYLKTKKKKKTWHIKQLAEGNTASSKWLGQDLNTGS